MERGGREEGGSACMATGKHSDCCVSVMCGAADLEAQSIMPLSVAKVLAVVEVCGDGQKWQCALIGSVLAVCGVLMCRYSFSLLAG